MARFDLKTTMINQFERCIGDKITHKDLKGYMIIEDILVKTGYVIVSQYGVLHKLSIEGVDRIYYAPYVKIRRLGDAKINN